MDLIDALRDQDIKVIKMMIDYGKYYSVTGECVKNEAMKNINIIENIRAVHWRPRNIISCTIDEYDNLYVAHEYENSISVYKLDGYLLYKLRITGIHEPRFIKIVSNNLYIIEFENFDVTLVNLDSKICSNTVHEHRQYDMSKSYRINTRVSMNPSASNEMSICDRIFATFNSTSKKCAKPYVLLEAQFQYPQRIAVLSESRDVFVAYDSCLDICVFNHQGTFQRKFTTGYDDTDDTFDSCNYQLAFDTLNHLWITDPNKVSFIFIYFCGIVAGSNSSL